jgi:hypothetical protein
VENIFTKQNEKKRDENTIVVLKKRRMVKR